MDVLVHVLTGPFSWKKPSREEQPGPPYVRFLRHDIRKDFCSKEPTISPEEELVAVFGVIRRPEPVVGN